MPKFENQGVDLHYRDIGDGPAVLFLHEFGGDHRSWEAQVGYFSQNYRCIVASARGYPPSAIPEDVAAYGQDLATADAVALLDHLKIEKAYVIGLSMGAYTGLMLALQHRRRLLALVAASGGAGSFPQTREAFIADASALAEAMIADGRVPAEAFANGPTRIQLKRKDIRRWREFRDHLAEHPALGSGNTLSRVQAARPSLYEFEAELAQIDVPVLLMVGDEDDPCLDTNLYLKRTMPTAGLAVVPKSGHLLNLEDPVGFNAAVSEFFDDIERGAWPPRKLTKSLFAGVGVNREADDQC